MYTTSGLSFLAFFFLLVIWIGLFLTWSISIWDIFMRRHDLSGGAKAGYFILVIVIPFIGTIIYLMLRPRNLDAHVTTAKVEGATTSTLTTAEQLDTLARLHAAGHLTDEEFARQKAKLS
jgi:Short C-terminal domain/Phospholipase_D-nuclease N-terminal